MEQMEQMDPADGESQREGNNGNNNLSFFSYGNLLLLLKFRSGLVKKPISLIYPKIRNNNAEEVVTEIVDATVVIERSRHGNRRRV